MSSEVDAAVLALLRSVAADLKAADSTAYLGVFDGWVTDSDGVAKTISAPLPYAVYYGSTTAPINPRIGGSGDNRSNDVRISCVGRTREQADWAADKVEKTLHEARVGRRQMRLDERTRPSRDDSWTRPDGGPLFYGALRFTV